MTTYFQKYLQELTRWTAWLGMGFLIAAMLVTVSDILLRKINNQGIFGAVDIVQLMIVAAAFLSIPHGFMTRGHVAVSIVVDRFGLKGEAFANLLAGLLGAGFMGAVAWFGWEQAVLQAGYGDVSLTLGIPKTYYWIPLLLGSFLSAIVCLFLSLDALKTLFNSRRSRRAYPFASDQREG